MIDELPEIDELRLRATRGPRPEPDRFFDQACKRASRRSRRRVVAGIAVVAVAAMAISLIATRRLGSSDLSTVEQGPTQPTSATTTTPSSNSTSATVTTTSSDPAELLRTGGILVQDGADLVAVDPDTGAR